MTKATDQSRRFSFALAAIFAIALAPATVRAQTNPWAVPDPSHAIFSCGDLTVSDGLIDSAGINGTATTHRGDLASNGNIKLSNGTIDGNATPGPGKTFTRTGGSITGTTTSATSLVPCTPIDLTALSTTLKTTNSNANVPKSTGGKDPLSGSTHTDFSLSGGDHVTLPAGTYYFTKFSMSGASTVSITGNVNILVNGAVSISGGSVAGSSSYQLRFWSTATNFSFSSATLVGFIYAPSGTINLSSDTVKGTVFANAVSVSGGAAHITRIIDDASPQVAITSPANGNVVADPAHVTVTGTASDDQGAVTVTVNGQAATVASDGTFSVTINVGTTSPATITAIATDGAGNTAQASVSVSTTPATPPPTVTLTSPASGSLLPTTTADLAGTVTNATTVTVNGLPATINSGVWTLPQFSLGPDGVHTLTIVASGPGGSKTINPKIENDTLAPAVAITSPLTNACLNGPNVSVNGSVSDPHLSVVTAALGTNAPVNATITGGTFTATLPAATEGKFVLTIKATDSLGHTATALGSVIIDRTKPAISVTSNGIPFKDGAYKQPLSLFVRATDADPNATLTTALNGNAYVSGTPITADGTYTLTASSTDCAGNASDPVTIHFTIDTVAPKIGTITPTSGTVVAAATNITGPADDAVTVALDVVPPITATISGTQFTFTNVPLVEGTNNFTIVATDAAGNQSRTPYSLTLDSKGPVLTITDGGTPIADHAIFRQNVTPVITANEDATITATLNSQPFTSGRTLTTDGSYTLAASATDGARNTGQKTVVFTIAKSGPAVQITSPAANATINAATVTVNGTASGSSVAGVRVNGVVATLGSDGSYIAVVPLDPGPNVLTATATDANGNSGTASIGVVRDDGKLAILLIAPADNTYVNQPVITVAGQLLSAAAGGTVTINGAPVTPDATGAFHKSDVAVVEGDNTITATVVAPNGNTNSVSAHIHGDFTPPVVHLTAGGVELKDGATFTTAPSIDVTATDTSQVLVSVTLDGASATTPITGLATGGHAISVVVTDLAKNMTRIDRSFAIGSSTTSATCTFGTFDPPDGSAVYEANVKISGQSAAANVLVNGQPASVSDGTFTASVALQTGRNDISLQCAGTNGVATNDPPKTLTLYRYTDSTIVITSPQPDAIFTTGKATVTGTVGAGVVSGDVNGIPFAVPADGAASHTFSVPDVGLANGLNVLTARAVTSSSRVVMTNVHVLFLAATPQITITSPLPGTQTGAATIDVTGNYTNVDPSTIQITVGSSTLTPQSPTAQSDTTGTFRMTVPLMASATTTITATGRNHANVQATSSVDVTNVAGAPFITIATPADGTTYGSDATQLTITGTIKHLDGALVQVNGVPATLSVSGDTETYSASIAFSGTSGITPVIARVSTPDGQTATESIRIVKLAKPFAVSDSFPANNATSVDPGAMIVLLFTNPLDGSTLTGAFTLRDASNALVSGETFVDKDALSFAPRTPLTPGTTYTFTVAQSLHDIAGGTLASPFTLVFSVATTAPDSAPSVDQADASGCITATSLTGHASAAGARLRLDIDSVSMTTTAAADKSFRFDFSISGQPGYHIARVREVGADGSLSPDRPITYRIECAAPSVVAATLDRVAKKLTIQFSTAMNASTLTASPTGTIQLAPKDGTAVTGTVALDASGQIATVTTNDDLSADTITLLVKKEVQNTTGVPMALDYHNTFSQTPVQAGQGYVTGAVYDATTGRPLAGVQVDTAAPVNAFGKHAATSSVRLQPVSFSTSNPPTDDHGRYTRALAEGAYTIQASADGYTTVWRQVVVQAGSGIVPIDIRLTRRSAEQTFGGSAITLASGGDTAVTEPAELALTSASLASGKKIALTSVGGQSLAGLLPLGWSPIASAEIEIDKSSIPAPLTAKLTFILSADQIAAVNAAAQSLALAQYDSDRDEWRTVAPVTIVDANRRATFDITSSGNYALVYPDKQTISVQAPAPAASGAALQGVPNPCSASTTACSLTSRSFILNPSSVAPNGRTVATLTVDGGPGFPSGTAVQAYIDEQLNLTDGRVLIDPPFATDLLIYRSLASDTGIAQFHLAPTATAATAGASVTLRDGVDHIRVVDYPGRIDRGALIGSEGGRVPGDGSVTIEIPTGAVLQAVHASSAAITTLPSNIAGFRIAGGFTFSTGGATLLKPARATFTVAANGAQVILAEELGTTPFGLMYRLAAQTQKIGDNLYSTVNTALAGGNTALPVDGLIREGRYFILVAQQPIAFAYGRVVFVTGAAAPDARVTSGTPILGVNDLTRAGGTFAIPVPATAFTLTPRHITTGDGAAFTAPTAAAADAIVNAGTLTLTIDAPKLVSVTPTGEIDATSAFVATAQFDRAIDVASATGAFTVTNLTTGHLLAGTVTGAANSISFTSSEPLAAASRYAITVGATIRGSNGAPLGQAFVQAFSTRAVPVNSSINAAKIRITIPDANGQSIVSGTAGALPAGAQALAVRRNRAFITQYQATVASDGSFSFAAGSGSGDSITIADAIDLNVIDAVSRSTIAIIPLTPFVTADGTGFVAPTGTTTKFTSPDGTTVTVPAGAFAQPTIVTVTSGTKADFAAVPNFDTELSFAAAVHLNFDGIANKPLDIEIPVPSTVTTANRNFVLGILGNSMRGPRVMIVDTLAVANGKFTTAATGSSSQRISAGIMSKAHTSTSTDLGEPVKNYLLHPIQGGTYSALEVESPNSNAPVGWGVIDGIQKSTELFFDKYQSLYASQLYILEGRGRIAVPMPANTAFTVEGVDGATGLTSFTKSYQVDASQPGFASVLPAPAAGGSGPYPLYGAPFRIETVDLAAQDIDLTSVRGYTVRLTAGGAILTPDSGQPAVHVLDVTNGLLDKPAKATLNDRLVLLIPQTDVEPTAQLQVVFNIPIALADSSSDAATDASLKQLMSFQQCADGTCNDVTAQPVFSIDSSHRIVTLTLTSELQRGASYQLRLSRTITETGSNPRALAQTTTGTTLTDDLYLPFTVRASNDDPIGTTTLQNGVIRDLALDGNILFVSSLSGGIQAFDVSNPAATSGPPMATVAAPNGGESWAVVTDHYGRVFATMLTDLFGVVRSYRLQDFAKGGAVPQKSNMIVSWRPGISLGAPQSGDYALYSDRPEATPRKMQITAVDDQDVYENRGAFEAATGPSPTGILQATAAGSTTYGDFNSYTVTVPFLKTLQYRVQPATVENLTLGLRWSADAVDGAAAKIENVLLRAGDRVRISRSRSSYAVVSLFGYGVAVVDVNAMESNSWPNPPSTYKPLATLIGATNAPSPTACTGNPCPIPDLSLSPEATIKPAGDAKFDVVAIDSTRGLLDLTVSNSNPAISRNGPGLLLTNHTSPASDNHPRLQTLRDATRKSSLIARFSSIARFTTDEGRNYALVAAAQFGLLVFDLDSTLSNDALADIIWIPAGAWGVRVLDGTHYAAVVDGAGRDLLVDLSTIDERASVTAPNCTAPDCPSRLFPTVAKSIAAGPQPVATDFGADDPRIIWKSKAGTTATTLAPVGDGDTGILISGDLLTQLVHKLASVDPKLHVIADLGSGAAEINSVIPAGIAPPSGVSGTPSAFHVETALPGGIGDAVTNLALTLESESAVGFKTADTPTGYPRAQLSSVPLRHVVPDDPALVMSLRYQRGYNLFTTPLVRAVADPRAAKDYGSIDPADACFSCAVPSSFAGDSQEIFTLGRFIHFKAAGTITATPYAYLDGKLDTRLPTVPADTVRPTSALVAAQQPPIAGGLLQETTYLHSGELETAATDLDAGGRAGWNVALDRTYRSRTIGFTPLGAGWTSSIFRHLRALPNGSVEYRDGEGELWTFTLSGNDYLAPAGLFLALTKTERGWTLRDQKWRITTFDDLGRLVSESDEFYKPTDPNSGNTIRYLYNAAGQLTTIVDPVNRATTLTYRADGLVDHIIDWRLRMVGYVYQSGHLTAVNLPQVTNTSPNQVPRIEYGYEPATSSIKDQLEIATNLLSIKDPNEVATNGKPRVIFTYTGDKVMGQQWATGESATFGYGASPPTATVTDVLGQSRSYALTTNTQDPRDDRAHFTQATELQVPVWSGAAFGFLPSTLTAGTPQVAPQDRVHTFGFTNAMLTSATIGGVRQMTTTPPQKPSGAPGFIITSSTTTPLGGAIALGGQKTSTMSSGILPGAHAITQTFEFQTGTANGSTFLQAIKIGDQRVESPEPHRNNVDATANNDSVAATTSFDVNGLLKTMNSAGGTDTGSAGATGSIQYFKADDAALYRRAMPQFTTSGATGPNPLTTETKYPNQDTTIETDPRGIETTTTYDAWRRPIDVVTKNTKTSGDISTEQKFQYDATGRLKQIDEKKGADWISTIYEYDIMGRRTSVSRNGVLANGSLTTVTTQTNYDVVNQKLAHIVTTLPSSATITNDLDTLGRTTHSVTNTGTMPGASPIEQWMAYDIDGNRVYSTDMLTATAAAFDAHGRAIATLASDGTITTTDHDDFGHPTTMKELDSSASTIGQTDLSVTPAGKITAATTHIDTALTRTTNFAWDGAGRTTSTATNGRASKSQYDIAGRFVDQKVGQGDISAITQLFQHTQVTVHDGALPAQTQTSEKSGGNYLASMSRNTTGDITSSKVGTLEWQAKFDELGNRTEAAVPGRPSTKLDVDSRGAVKTQMLPDGATQSYDYTSTGAQKNFTDPANEPTSTQTDLLGRPLTRTYKDGTTEVVEWESTRIKSVTDRQGRKQSFTYNAKGQLTDVADGSNNPVEHLTYDSAGRLTSWRNADSEITWSDFDLAGNPKTTTQKRFAAGSGMPATSTPQVIDIYTEQHRWNEHGERTYFSMPVYSGLTLGTGWTKWIREQYDAAGNTTEIAKMDDPSAQPATILMTADYVNAGRPSIRTVVAGNLTSSAVPIVRNYTYDPKTSMLKTLSVSVNNTVIAGADLTYDGIQKSDAKLLGVSGGNRYAKWRYDKRSRLASSLYGTSDPAADPSTTVPGRAAEALTPADFRTGQDRASQLDADTNAKLQCQGAQQPPCKVIDTSAIDPPSLAITEKSGGGHKIDSLTKGPAVSTFGYNGAEVVDDGRFTYTFDVKGRLTTATEKTISATHRRVVYSYSGTGRLVGRRAEYTTVTNPSSTDWKLEDRAGIINADGLPAETTFVWDPISDRLITIAKAGAQTTDTQGGIIKQIIHGEGDYDDPIETACIDPITNAVNYLYPVYDEAGAGSLQTVLNVKGQIVARNVPLDPFGGENVDLAGAAIDRVSVTASKDSTGAITSVEVSIRSTEALAPSTIVGGVHLAALDDKNAVVHTATATPSLLDANTVHWTLNASDWSALTNGASSLSIAATNTLRASTWSSDLPILPAPDWAKATRPVFSDTYPVEVREPLSTLNASIAAIANNGQQTTTVYEVQDLALAAVGGDDSVFENLLSARMHAHPFTEPLTALDYVRNRWYSSASGAWITPDPLGYRDSSNLYAFAGGDPVNGRDPSGLADWTDGSSALEIVEDAAKWTPVVIAGGKGTAAAAASTGSKVVAEAAAPVAVGLAGGILANWTINRLADLSDLHADEYVAQQRLEDTKRMAAQRQKHKVPMLPGVTPYSQQAQANPAAANQLAAYHNAAVSKRQGARRPTPKDARTRVNPTEIGPLPQDIANTFRSGTYDEVTLAQPATLYRAYSDPKRKIGPFWTRTKPTGPLQVTIDSALDQNWGNQATNVVTIKVPAGQTIYEGPAAPQRGLVGGVNQVYIPKVDPNWEVDK